MKNVEKDLVEKLNSENNFTSYVLFSNRFFDKNEIFLNLKNDYRIKIDEDLKYYKEIENVIIFEFEESVAVIEYVDEKLDLLENDKIIKNMAITSEDFYNNIKNHLSHIVVYTSSDKSMVQLSILNTKITASCLKNNFSVGVINHADIFEKEKYFYFLEMMKSDLLPIDILIKCLFVDVGGKLIASTIGMEKFDHLDFEVSNVGRSDMEDVYVLLQNLAYFSLDNNIDFRDGETFTLKSMEDKFNKVNIEVGKSDYFEKEKVVKIKL